MVLTRADVEATRTGLDGLTALVTRDLILYVACALKSAPATPRDRMSGTLT